MDGTGVRYALGIVLTAGVPFAGCGDRSEAHSPSRQAGRDAAGDSSARSSASSDAGTGSETAGSPHGACGTGLPAAAQAADTSHPTTVVGTGTAASCTFAALAAAVSKAGVIAFDCGRGAVTIPVTSTLNVPVDTNTVIDGGNAIVLDGGNATRILAFDSPDFQANESRLTLQHISLVRGKATPTRAIPTAPTPCSQGWNDGEGGAVYVRDGNLTVIDSTFTDNQAAPLGPDTGGGAIYVLGSKHGALIVGSTFAGNTASNGGAVGGLFAELDVYDSLFDGNKAVGNGANNNDPAACAAMNNGQNEVGSGGNGGALYSDGNSVNVILCGDAISNNAAGARAFGGGLFFTSDDMMGTLTIVDTSMTANTGGSWTHVSMGSVTAAGTAIGVNAKSITVTSSILQGYP